MNPKRIILNTLKQKGVKAVSLNYFKKNYSARDDEFGQALYELVASGEIREIKKYICPDCSNSTGVLQHTEFEDGELVYFECNVCGAYYDKYETADISAVSYALFYADNTAMGREDEANGNS